MEGPKQIDLRSLWFFDLLTLLEPIEKFTDEVKKITALEALDFTEKMTMIREARSGLSRELEERFETFGKQLKDRKKELQDIVNPPKPDFAEQMRLLLKEVASITYRLLGRRPDQGTGLPPACWKTV